MTKITDFVDNTARFLLDPANKKFSPVTRAIAWLVTALTCFATLGLLQIAIAIWQKVRHIKEPNETQQMITKIYQNIFHKKPIKKDEPIPSQENPVKEKSLNENPIPEAPLDPVFSSMLDFINARPVSLTDRKGLYAPMPCVRAACTEESIELPDITPPEQEAFIDMGKMIATCYVSNVKVEEGQRKFLGRHFDDALFKALLVFTEEELEYYYSDLNWETIFKLGKTLLMARVEMNDEESNIKSFYYPWLTAIIEYDSTSVPIRQEVAAKVFKDIQFLNGEINDTFLEYSVNLLNDKPEKFFCCPNFFKTIIIRSVLCSQFEFAGGLMKQIPAIYAIAKGFKAELAKENIKYKELNIDYLNLSAIVQGPSIDRKKLAEKLVLKTEEKIHGEIQSIQYTEEEKKELNKEIGWLKEWIEKDAEEADLRRFLRFTTKSSLLSEGNIIIKAQKAQFRPFLKGHTCSGEVEIAEKPTVYIVGGKEYNDCSKEAFIDSIQQLNLHYFWDSLIPESYSSIVEKEKPEKWNNIQIALKSWTLTKTGGTFFHKKIGTQKEAETVIGNRRAQLKPAENQQVAILMAPLDLDLEKSPFQVVLSYWDTSKTPEGFTHLTFICNAQFDGKFLRSVQLSLDSQEYDCEAFIAFCQEKGLSLYGTYEV